MKYSTNEKAEKIVGKRDIPEGAMIIDFPLEFGYQCPVCKVENDEGLEWSEYQGFLWCEKCNKDYPTVICQPDVDKAIDLYLEIVSPRTLETLIERASSDLRSISWHSDGRVIAKSGAGAKNPRKLYSAKSPEEAVGKLIADNQITEEKK